MSNFDTNTNITGGVPGLAANLFSAATEDDLATITATGYLNDLGAERVVKRNDIFFINYLATDIASAVMARFIVTIVGSDFDLVAFA